MKYYIFFLFLLCNTAFAGWFQTTCEYTGYRDVPISTRIDDSKLSSRQKEGQWRPADLKSGECLYHVDSGKCSVSGVGNNPIYNAQGYTYSAWAEVSNSPFYPDYCRNCLELNKGKPQSGTINAYHSLWDGYKYIQCYDKNGVFGSNFDGCYNITWQQEEYKYSEPCMQYICYETDEGDEHGLYPCRVQCPQFNNVAQYDYRFDSYVCRPDPEPEPEPEDDCTTKAGVFTCFADDITNRVDNNTWTLTNIFYELSEGVKSLFENLSFDKNDDDTSEYPSSDGGDSGDVDPTELNADLPFFDVSSSINNLSIFKSDVQCPASNSINIMSTTIQFSYSKLCSALALMSNLVLLLGFFFGYKILRSA